MAFTITFTQSRQIYAESSGNFHAVWRELRRRDPGPEACWTYSGSVMKVEEVMKVVMNGAFGSSQSSRLGTRPPLKD